MAMNYLSSVEGYYTARIHGGARGDIDVFMELGHKDGAMQNLILDSGMMELVGRTTTTSTYSRIALGSGNSIPSPLQTQLDAGGVSSPSGVETTGFNAAGGYGFRRLVVEFAQGAAQGTWSEIGAGWATSPTGPMFSRALILDAQGNPTALTILPDEFLTCTYELRVWRENSPPQQIDYIYGGETFTTTATLTYPDDTREDYLGSAPSAGAAQYTLSARWSGSSGAGLGQVGRDANGFFNECLATYNLNAGNPEIATLTRLGNAGGRSLLPADTTIVFDPPIAKSNTDTVDIAVRSYIRRRGE